MKIHSPFLFAIRFLLVGFPNSGEFHVSLNRSSAAVNDVDFKSWKGRTESSALPLFDSEIAVGGAMVTILWQTRAIAPHICATQVQDMYTKTLNTSDLSFNVGDSRHKQFPLVAIIAESGRD